MALAEIDWQAALSPKTKGSLRFKSGPLNKQCTNEVRVVDFSGIKCFCAALLDKDFYKACQMKNGICPISTYQKAYPPIKK